MAEERKTTEFNKYDKNKIKTLDDLFNYEANIVKKLDELKRQLGNKAFEAQKENIKKQLEIEYAGYKELVADIEKEAAASVKRQTEKRLDSYLTELAEYKQFLKQQTSLNDKKINKQVKSFEKAQKIEEKTLKSRKSREGKEELIKAKQARKADRQAILENSKYTFGGVGTFGQQMTASLAKVGENIGKAVGKAFNDISNKINSAMDTFSKYQSSIDTRLQESGKNFTDMQKSLKSAVGASPYLKTETMLNNLQSLVEAGIVTNVEQRAFLNTIKDKIAGTFDAANSSLLRIVRLQQNDSTAARLGMEAYLTRFLNVMVENTEYLTTTFDNVQEALIEASSMMSTKASTEFEYIVQKWLGTLVGRGMSESTATSLAGALGMLGSGNVSGLSGNSLNNLLVMASSRAGLDYADLLTSGLGAYETNQLMAALVKYMQEINSSGSNVVRSQYAQTFGLSVSDLMAASGISDINSIYGNFISYEAMYDELSDQFDKVSSRTHISEKISNLFENAQFSLASNIAGNATMAAMWKVTDMIQGVTGGINIPAISVVGNMVDLETTVENLMKLGLVGAGSLGMIGDVVTGLANSGGNFSNILNRLSINAKSANFRGNTSGRGLAARGSGLTTSLVSSLVAQSSSEDIQNQTLNSAMDEGNKQLAEAQSEQDNPSADLRNYFIDVFDAKFSNLLNMIAHNNGYDNGMSSVINDTIAINDNRSVVRTTYRVDEGSNTSLVESIESKVSGIYTLLQNGISVSVNNFPTNFGNNNAGIGG